MKFAQLNYSVKDGEMQYHWEGELHLPLKLGEEYFAHCYFHKCLPPYPWPIKIVAENVRWFPPYVVAVRTDIQPFWWIVVAVQYELEQIIRRLNRAALEVVYLLGMMDLEEGMMPHWKRVKLFPSRRA